MPEDSTKTRTWEVDYGRTVTIPPVELATCEIFHLKFARSKSDFVLIDGDFSLDKKPSMKLMLLRMQSTGNIQQYQTKMSTQCTSRSGRRGYDVTSRTSGT